MVRATQSAGRRPRRRPARSIAALHQELPEPGLLERPGVDSIPGITGHKSPGFDSSTGRSRNGFARPSNGSGFFLQTPFSRRSGDRRWRVPVSLEIRRPPNRRARRATKAAKAIPGTTDCCPKCKSPRVHLHANHDIKFYGRQLAICTNCLMGAARQGPDLGPFGPVRFAARAVRQLCVPAGLARAGRHRDVERTHRQASRRRHLPLP
jgi:hypothetical protein